MRPNLIVYSASALVVGVMCLVFGSALNPSEAGAGVTAAVRVASDHSGRWLGMAVLWFCASVALTAGLPAILSLFQARAHRLGIVGVGVLSIGAIGTSGFAMLLVFVAALVNNDAIRVTNMDDVLSDRGLGVFLWSWATGFYLGSILVAIGLIVARTTHLWVPIALLAYVLFRPLDGVVGEIGPIIRQLALVLAFTGMAVAAVSQTQRTPETFVV
ncbi:hypothetical protein [Nocardioides iriomotensis]|uniref:DUF4386 family protein n=1 Tax=Nocardioides iriomotensis TaxID=715784 RepID=A0A4Q5J024_9ACTN|nr:hypothetical protein [Nocardioides iriomotensis]RYU10948.1 hypothetical protein ETU37_14640 [Nocardioides iriomotensis]